mgnify:CR=1 FL=1
MNRKRVLIPVVERAHLVEDARENGCTLDGKPAYVTGYNRETAAVTPKGHGNGGSVEFAWATVARILSTHRNFQS